MDKINIPILEKSIEIPIQNNIFSNKKYSLTNHFFDPCKNSPPNDFMIKLQMRLNKSNVSVNKT